MTSWWLGEYDGRCNNVIPDCVANPCATVRTGCSSKDARIKSRSTAISLTGRLVFHSRRPSKPPSRNVEHDRGESSGSAALAARRAGYPWTEQMSRKLSRKVRETASSNSRNAPSEDRKWWGRIELGIHGLRSWVRKMSRKVRETGSSGGLQGHEGGRGPPTYGRPGSVVGSQRPLRHCSPAPRPLPPAGNWVCFPARFRLGSS